MRRRTLLRAAAGTLSLSVVARRGAAQGYEPLGRVPIRGATEVVVADDGKTAFLATTTGFATADVSDPRNPTVLADRRNLLSGRENGPLRDIRDVKCDGDRLIVVGPANPADGVNAMVLYDVSDPASPRRVAVHETDYAIHNAFLTDGYAYLSQYNQNTVGLAIVDVSNDDPRQVGEWSILDEPGWGRVPRYLVPVHDVWVQDGIAYIAHWDAGTWLLDVLNPHNPAALTRVGGRPPKRLARLSEEAMGRALLTPPGNAHYVSVNDDASLLGVGVESWRAEGRGGPGGITLWDISSPKSPERLAHIAPPPSPNPTYGGVWTTAHNFDLASDRLYSSWYQGGVRAHDVSDPRAPRQLAGWRTSGKTSFWAAALAAPGEFFVASSWNQYGQLPQSFLYTFPDRTASQGPVVSQTRTITRTATPRPTATPTDSTEGTSTATTGTEGPGFGSLAALAGLGIGAWHRLRRE